MVDGFQQEASASFLTEAELSTSDFTIVRYMKHWKKEKIIILQGYSNLILFLTLKTQPHVPNF